MAEWTQERIDAWRIAPPGSYTQDDWRALCDLAALGLSADAAKARALEELAAAGYDNCHIKWANALARMYALCPESPTEPTS